MPEVHTTGECDGAVVDKGDALRGQDGEPEDKDKDSAGVVRCVPGGARGIKDDEVGEDGEVQDQWYYQDGRGHPQRADVR